MKDFLRVKTKESMRDIIIFRENFNTRHYSEVRHRGSEKPRIILDLIIRLNKEISFRDRLDSNEAMRIERFSLNRVSVRCKLS